MPLSASYLLCARGTGETRLGSAYSSKTSLSLNYGAKHHYIHLLPSSVQSHHNIQATDVGELI